MTAAVRLTLQVAVVALAVSILALGLWWAFRAPPASIASGSRPDLDAPAPELPAQATQATEAADAGGALPATPSPIPQPTPLPTPTPAPVDFLTALARPDWEGVMGSPAPGCGFAADPPTIAGALALRCLGESGSIDVVSSAPGRVVHVVNEPRVAAVSEPAGAWSWFDQQSLGRHIVVDHGPYAGSRNTQTVYAGLEEVGDLGIGDLVEAGDVLGSIGGPDPVLMFSVWVDDIRQDGAGVEVAAPPAETQREAAAALRERITSPTDRRCPLSLGWGQLPGASRAYRNGTHRGIDFGCGAPDRSAFAISDGRVVYLVDDYDDPSVGEREALLANAGRAGFTPHWTLVMLYGNVVVIDHGVIPGAGRVVTISAHLESVSPDLALGQPVTQGQVLGEIGNRGTNASAAGIRGNGDPSLHLHWELFIDGWYLGAGLNSPTVSELVTTALCGPAQTAGCPVSS